MKLAQGVIWASILLMLTVVAMADDGCYLRDTVYLAYSMNVRERPTTNSPIATSLLAGQTIQVSQSEQGITWCWLETQWGWVAKTGRVRDVKPTEVKTQTTTHTIVLDLPPAEKTLSRQALDWLRTYRPEWYEYANNITDRIEMVENSFCGLANSNHPRTVFMTTRTIYPCGYATIDVAMLLVHEACHLYQYSRGEHHGWDFSIYYNQKPWERPWEIYCLSIETDAYNGIPPPA